MLECGVFRFSFKGNKHDVVHQDGETISIRSTITDNSHVYILTDTLLDVTPEIFTVYKIFLLVHPTEVFLWKQKKSNTYVSVHLRNTDTTLIGVNSRVLSHLHEKVDHPNLFTKASRWSMSHTPSTRSTTAPIPFNENRHLF